MNKRTVKPPKPLAGLYEGHGQGTLAAMQTAKDARRRADRRAFVAALGKTGEVAR